MRRRVRKEVVGMALFPFLAVLICTMGALVVLLVLLVQQAKVDAEIVVADQSRAQTQSPKEQQDEQLALEDARWRQEVLEKQRQEKQQELADRRLELSHIEDHIRRLEDSVRMLTTRIKEFDQGQTDQQTDLTPLRQQLDELRGAIAAKRQELDAKRKRLAQEQQSYTLIPYEGRSGTRRRPLYVECVAEGIIVQPEGVLITLADMEGPLGSGNPLDAALRAKSEFLARATEGNAGTPYPLLVVRPSGIVPYQAAREAIKAWDDEFGYELISEELPLDFGERDARLDQLLHKTVQEARRRQAVLAASMPRKFRQTELLPPSAVAQHAPAERGKSQAPGIGVGAGQGGMAVGRGAPNAGGHASAVRPPADTVATSQESAAQAEPAAAKNEQQPPTTDQRNGPGSMRQAGGAAGGVIAGKMRSGAPPGTGGQRRGANWGLPNARGRTFGVSRPIRVICLSDRIVLLPDRRDVARPLEFPLSKSMTVQELDAFVAAIQKQMEGWGLAAENGYWKPELHVEVGGGAEARFEELQSALQGSGIDVQRKLR